MGRAAPPSSLRGGRTACSCTAGCCTGRPSGSSSRPRTASAPTTWAGSSCRPGKASGPWRRGGSTTRTGTAWGRGRTLRPRGRRTRQDTPSRTWPHRGWSVWHRGRPQCGPAGRRDQRAITARDQRGLASARSVLVTCSRSGGEPGRVKKRDVLPAETGWSMLGPRPPLARSWWKIAGSRTCEKIRVETKQVSLKGHGRGRQYWSGEWWRHGPWVGLRRREANSGGES